NCNNATDWSVSWVVFVDEDDSGAWSAGDTVISRSKPGKGVKVLSNQTSFGFQPGYRRLSGLNGTYAICVDDDDEKNRWIIVSASGRPRLVDEKPESGPGC